VYIKLRTYNRNKKFRQRNKEFAYEAFRGETLRKKRSQHLLDRIASSFPDIPTDVELAEITKLQNKDWELQSVQDVNIQQSV
jgi:hypothetical protein